MNLTSSMNTTQINCKLYVEILSALCEKFAIQHPNKDNICLLIMTTCVCTSVVKQVIYIVSGSQNQSVIIK